MTEYIRSYFHTPTEKEMNSSIYITWTGHRVCTPDHSIGPRILNNYKIVLVLKGKGYFIQENKEYNITAGDMFVLFPGVKHHYYANAENPWEIVWVAFNGRLCSETMDSLDLTPKSPIISRAGTYRIAQLMKDITDGLEGENKACTFKSTGSLYLLFSELIPLSKSPDKKGSENTKEDCIKKALSFIDFNYYNDIDVDILCRHVNFSRSYFSRLFKKKVGLSIPEHINIVRINQSKILLKNSGLNVNEIAKSVGFEDQFYFSRIFRKLVGISPIAYRNQD